MDSFETFPEQPEAKRLLRASLADGPAHAYLFHGPRGVGKRAAALAFAAELIGEPDRVLRHAHPDVYELEPVGDQIRIGDIARCTATCRRASVRSLCAASISCSRPTR